MNGVYNVQKRWVCSVIRKLNEDLTNVISYLIERYNSEAGPFLCSLTINKRTPGTTTENPIKYQIYVLP